MSPATAQKTPPAKATRRSAAEPLVLRKGQIWEHFTSEVLGYELIGTYELVHIEVANIHGLQARLRNLETDGIAMITQRWLYEGESRKPHPHWRLVG